eukprot:3790452-Prymnesium_polylepis.1
MQTEASKATECCERCDELPFCEETIAALWHDEVRCTTRAHTLPPSPNPRLPAALPVLRAQYAPRRLSARARRAARAERHAQTPRRRRGQLQNDPAVVRPAGPAQGGGNHSSAAGATSLAKRTAASPEQAQEVPQCHPIEVPRHSRRRAAAPHADTADRPVKPRPTFQLPEAP